MVGTFIPLNSATSVASQPAPPRLAQSSDEAALDEAARLNEQAIELYEQGRYAEAKPRIRSILMALGGLICSRQSA
ncbi:MAG: hypothetical protein AAGF01_20310 [Cyanobacteria bacterium P01_G01_bin.38]